MKAKQIKKVFICWMALCIFCTGIGAYGVQSPLSPSGALPWNGKLYVNGQAVAILNKAGDDNEKAISSDGTVYVPADTAASWYGKSLALDPDSQILSFASGGTVIRYELKDQVIHENPTTGSSAIPVIVLEDIRVFSDGTEITYIDSEGIQRFPLEYRNTIYIPIRVAAQIGNMDVVWVARGKSQSIYLRTPLSDSQETQIKNYILSVYNLCDKLDTSAFMFWESGASDPSLSLNYADTISKIVSQLKNLQKPDAEFVDYYYNDCMQHIFKFEKQITDCVAKVKDGSTPAEIMRQSPLGYIDFETERQSIKISVMFLQDVFDQLGYINLRNIDNY